MRRRRPKTTESCTIQKQLPNKKPHSMSTTFYHSNLKVKAKHSEKTIKTDYSNPDYLPIDAPMHTSFDNARKTNNN